MMVEESRRGRVYIERGCAARRVEVNERYLWRSHHSIYTSFTCTVTPSSPLFCVCFLVMSQAA
jgi:hypothetical protein